MPTTTFNTFANPIVGEFGASDTDGQLSGSFGGVTFTVSYPSGGGNHFAVLGSFLSITNTTFTGTQSFTLTWDDGSSGTQASSISVNGAFESNEVFFLLAGGGSTTADSGVAFSGQVTGVKFVLAGASDAALITSLGLSINCFAPGTRIATKDGATAVEDLAPGDLVTTADGRQVPITWVGRQSVNSRAEHPAKVNPIRITKGALGYGLPTRDLRLSRDHAIEIDGNLYNAGALVNGVTIYQERGVLPEDFTYYHIETEAHELLVAEGVAAESFIDYASRDTFDNGDELGTAIPEMALPRVSSERHVPEHIRDRLLPSIAAE